MKAGHYTCFEEDVEEGFSGEDEMLQDGAGANFDELGVGETGFAS